MSKKYVRAHPGAVRVGTKHGEEGAVTVEIRVSGVTFKKRSKHKRRDLWEKQAVKWCQRLGKTEYYVTYYGNYVPAGPDHFPDWRTDTVEISK